jgi:hypothetical protein
MHSPTLSPLRHWVRALVACAVLAVVAWPRAAAAQSIAAIDPVTITRDAFLHTTTDPKVALWISRQDCINDDTLHFTLNITSYAGFGLSVWVGQVDCTDSSTRSDALAQCWNVLNTPINNAVFPVALKVRDIVGRHLPPALNSGNGTLADCTPDASLGTAGQPITIYFLLVQGGAQVTVGGTGTSWPTVIDLLGPAGPPVTGVGVGDTLLKIN